MYAFSVNFDNTTFLNGLKYRIWFLETRLGA